jgi:hypothetical protein
VNAGRFQRRALLVALSSIAAAVGVAALLWRVTGGPDSSLLVPAPGAEWIVCQKETDLHAKRSAELFAYFQTRLNIATPPASGRLEFRSLRDASVKIDGGRLLAFQETGERQNLRTVDLALGPGEHQVLFIVKNRNGPAALWARSRDYGLASGTLWQASCDGKTWSAAAAAGDLSPPEIARGLPTCASGFVAWLPLFVAVFFAAWRTSLLDRLRPQVLRVVLLLFWLALGIDGAFRLPLALGYDFPAHLAYVNFILEHSRLPLATEGWQMFQAPLYYLIGAALVPLQLFLLGMQAPNPAALRLINILAGAGLVEISARLMRRLWPQRTDLQCAGLLIAGLLPMNLALCQTIGNEPLSACFSALTILLVFAWMDGEKRSAAVGWSWGAALLAKTSAVLLAVLIIAAGAVTRRWRALVISFAWAATACGWYYGWVWSRLGRPFVGGWDASRGFEWWQDPGLRTVSHFFTFGSSLRQPVYAGLNGFWDSIYSTFWADGFISGIAALPRPPWRYGLMAAGMWWALLPTALILVGAFRAARGRMGSRGYLAIGMIGLYTAALLWLYLRLPIYSTAKATYLSGLTPLFGALTALGFDSLDWPRVRRVAASGLVVWAVAAALTYWP